MSILSIKENLDNNKNTLNDILTRVQTPIKF